MEKIQLTPTSCYVSNAFQYISPKKKKDFKDALDKITHENTAVIYSDNGENGGILKQNVASNKEAINSMVNSKNFGKFSADKHT